MKKLLHTARSRVAALWSASKKTEVAGSAAVAPAPNSFHVDRIAEARLAVASYFLTGEGIELGAGSRPFPLPANVKVRYGDVRDTAALVQYFSTTAVVSTEQRIDAQTLEGVPKGQLDFVLSAHVIEHLEDPIGAVVNTLSVLKLGGIFIVVVPDMRLTFDRDRPETPASHSIADFGDGGASTRKQAFVEHLRYCHPIMTNGVSLTEAEIERQATISAVNHKALDLHYHAWTLEGFRQLLTVAKQYSPFDIEIAIPIENENIFVLRKIT